MGGGEITAQWGEGSSDAITRETQLEVERRAILGLVCEACEQAPELESDWFAVSYMP
jgi:hypothetical protein